MPSDGSGQLIPTLALIGQLGLIMVLCVLGGFLAGDYLDRQLNTDRILTVVLLLAGIAGGMLAVYRLVMRAVEGDQREREQRG